MNLYGKIKIELMTKREAGRAIFEAIKADIKNSGQSMSANKFPANYPVCRRTCYNIGNGVFDEAVLKRLPFRVELEYTVRVGKYNLISL